MSKKIFHFPLLLLSKYCFNPCGLKRFIEGDNVNDFKATITKIVHHNFSLNLVAFTVPEKVIKQIVNFINDVVV